MKHLIDEKFRAYPVKYILQCSIAIITLVIVLLFLNELTHTALIASLGATVFTVFSRPNSYFSRTRTLLGGYCIGIISGVFMHFIYMGLINNLGLTNNKFLIAAVAAVAVGFAILLMVILNMEHAPAAGIALGLVVNQWDLFTLGFIIVSVAVIAFVKWSLRSFLIDLTEENWTKD
jgi:CBS-domain-containing membrane protein